MILMGLSYDGTLTGFLSLCIYAIKEKITPSRITINKAAYEPWDEDDIYVRTNKYLAKRFCLYLSKKTSPDTVKLVKEYFYTSEEHKEMVLFYYIYNSLRYGVIAHYDNKNEDYQKMIRAVDELYKEGNSIISSIIFKKYKGISVGIINPRNDIIPIMRGRLLGIEGLEDFILYDRRHQLIVRRRGDLVTYERETIQLDVDGRNEYEIIYNMCLREFNLN